MTIDTKKVTFPYAIKTVGITGVNAQPYYVNTQDSFQVTYSTEMAFEIFPPIFTYAPVGLYMHLNYTFSSNVPSQYQRIDRIYVRDTPSTYISKSGSTVENYLDVNWVADVNRNINQSIDLSSILTGLSTNVVFLRYPVQNYPFSGRGADTINLWKLDLIYQTIGIRDEK